MQVESIAFCYIFNLHYVINGLENIFWVLFGVAGFYCISVNELHNFQDIFDNIW